MYALVETCGKQYWVRPGEKVVVDNLNLEAGAEIILDRVLLLGGEPVVVGTPIVPGATVKAKVLGSHRGDKVATFKYVRRRRVRHYRASRADLTTLEITSIDKAE